MPAKNVDAVFLKDRVIVFRGQATLLQEMCIRWEINIMLNYRQLHYFWVVAKTGSIVRACEQLNLTPQTISGQISLLEQTYGVELFRRVGRQLELTEAGRQALPYAEQMFQLGGELELMLRAQPHEQQILFRVGVADVVPKSIVYRLIASGCSSCTRTTSRSEYGASSRRP